MNENNTKVILIYDGEVEFLDLTPEQMKLLDYFQENNYLADWLEVKADPEFEKI